MGQPAKGEGMIGHAVFAHQRAAHHVQWVEMTDRPGGVVIKVRTPASIIVSLVRDVPDRLRRSNSGQIRSPALIKY